MNLAEEFAIRNAATGSSVFQATETTELHGWEHPGRKLEIAYVIEDDFGIVGLTAGVFGMKFATIPATELQRRTVADAAGLIEQFSARNVSVILAQPNYVINVPRAVFLKRSPELRDFRRQMILYEVSDPFGPLYEKLVELRRSDPNPEAAPGSVALANAKRVLDAAREESTLPNRILPGSNGVFVYFSNGVRYAEVECDNDGDIGIVTSDRSGNPTLWFSESHQLRSDLARIRAFLV